MFKSLRAAMVLARSLKRIADALEEQNRIRKIELLEVYGLTIPDPGKKWSKQESEAEVIYGEQPTPEEQAEADEWADAFKT